MLRQDFIRTAKAKGLRPATVVVVHALPNAILPIIALIGSDFGYFMSQTVVVESVFGWPGIGQLAWQAIQRVDIPIIMGVTVVTACVVVIGNLLADLIAPDDRSAHQDPLSLLTRKFRRGPPFEGVRPSRRFSWRRQPFAGDVACPAIRASPRIIQSRVPKYTPATSAGT